MVFTMENLVHEYRWKYHPEEHPYFEKGPAFRYFNRVEGFEILFVINEYLAMRNSTDPRDGKKVEALIHESLPPKVYTHAELYRWLNENW